MPVALALDLGTTSTAAVAIDETGRLLHVVRRKHGADVEGLPAGHAEQDPQRHLSTAVEVLKELSAGLVEQPVSLGLTGQMHSVLMLDALRRPLGHLITWQDRRANAVIPGRQMTYHQELLSRCDPSAIHDTGCRFAPGFAAVSLFVQVERRELPPELCRVAILADWVAAELTDADVVTELSNATSTGVYDLRNQRWSDALISACQIDSVWLPQVVDCETAVGRLSRAMALQTGLPSGLPVIVAIGDNQASVLGSVPQGRPAIQITIGTGGQINWPVESFVRVDGMETRPLPPDRLMLVGAGLVGGDAFAWVNRTLRQWLAAFGGDHGADDVYSVLTRMASDVPSGAEGLTCEPFFRGTRPEPLRRGMFAGIGADNFTPGHVARAVLEGIANCMYALWTNAGELQPNVSRIVGCGNGLEEHPLLARIFSETFQLPVLLPRHAEAAAYGAALVAGVAAGFWPDLATAGNVIELRGVPGDAS